MRTLILLEIFLRVKKEIYTLHKDDNWRLDYFEVIQAIDKAFDDASASH